MSDGEKKGKRNESKIDYSHREFAREITTRRILFPYVPWSTDCAAMSEKMEGHTGKESGAGAVCGKVWEGEE